MNGFNNRYEQNISFLSVNLTKRNQLTFFLSEYLNGKKDNSKKSSGILTSVMQNSNFIICLLGFLIEMIHILQKNWLNYLDYLFSTRNTQNYIGTPMPVQKYEEVSWSTESMEKYGCIPFLLGNEFQKDKSRRSFSWWKEKRVDG